MKLKNHRHDPATFSVFFTGFVLGMAIAITVQPAVFFVGRSVVLSSAFGYIRLGEQPVPPRTSDRPVRRPIPARGEQ
jgi:hypothetical protein